MKRISQVAVIAAFAAASALVHAQAGKPAPMPKPEELVFVEGASQTAAVAAAAPARAAVRSHEIVSASAGARRNGEASLIALKDGSLLLLYGAHEKSGDWDRGEIRQISSRDGGKTWSEPETVFSDPQRSLFQCSLARLPSGNLGLTHTSLANGADAIKVFRRSSDEGRTWSGPLVISDAAQAYTTGPWDKLYVLESGRLISLLHCRLKPDAKKPGGPLGSYAVFSDDDAKTWTRSPAAGVLHVADNPHGKHEWGFWEPSLVERAPGKLLMLGRTTTGWLWESRSADNGATWSAPVRTAVPNPVAPPVLTRVPGTDTLVLIQNPEVDMKSGWHGGPRRALAFRTSTDDGRTWSGPTDIYRAAEDTLWVDYPAVRWIDGNLHVVWRHIRGAATGRSMTSLFHHVVPGNVFRPAATSAEAMKRAEFIAPPEVFLPHTASIPMFGILRQFIGPAAIRVNGGAILMIATWGRPPTNFEQLAAKFPLPMIYRSTDGGRTWKEDGRMQMDWKHTGMVSDGGISLLRLQDGRLAFLSHRHVQGLHGGGIPVFSTSADDGKTWAPAQLLDPKDDVYYVMNDRLIQLKSGRLVAPVCSPVKSLRKRYWEGAGVVGLFYLSDDGGKTWRPSRGQVVLPDDDRGIAEPCVAEVSPGRLLMLARTGKGCKYRAWSEDGGETWSESEPTTLTAACSSLTLRTLPDGRPIVFYNHVKPLRPGAFFPRTPLVYAVSQDGGKSWEEPVMIDDEGVGKNDRQNIYPCVCFTDEGMLVIYSTHAADPGGSFALDRNVGGGKRCIVRYPQSPVP